MKSSYCTVFLLFALSWLFPNHAHAQINISIDEAELIQIDKVTSSSFEMVLHPTPLKLDTSATEKISNIIKNLLLVSSSSSIDFFSFDAVKIFVEGVKFEDHYEVTDTLNSITENLVTLHVQASLLTFKITVDFYMQDETSTKTSTPLSQFAVDNLIARTFSQPSTKSNFLELIILTMDQFLVEIEDIEINLVEESLNEHAILERATSLSSIDIALIFISSLISVGVFCIFVSHCHKDSYEDVWEQNFSKEENINSVTVDDNRVDIGSNDGEKHQISLGKMMDVNDNIIEAGSLESSIDGQSQIVLSVVDESPVMSFVSSSSCDSTTSSSSSPSVYISSSEEYFDTSIDDSIFEIANTSIDSSSIQNKRHHDSKVLTKTADNLASKLLSLPSSGMYTRRLNSNVINSSSASAPVILEDIIGKWKIESMIDEKPIKSVRSTTSPECQKLKSKRNTTSLTSVHPFLKNQFVMNGFIMFETTKEFHKSWLESKRKALEDIEDGSVDDVFHIDVQQSENALEENNTINSALPTPVSEWMKLIRVVNSTSETQSSIENSTIEPVSFNTREIGSLDLSLEDSLAKSLVDLKLN